MRRHTGICFILFGVLFSETTFAQNVPSSPDSTTIYQNIESYSKKNKFTKFVYRLIFRPAAIVSPTLPTDKKKYKKLIQKPYSAFEGKIIRNIAIETLDPFGYKVEDSIVSDQNFLSRTGNKLHIKSQRNTIRNLLLIRENQVFDSLLVRESERLVRTQKYIREVLFFVVLTSNKSDSVDIFIRELDKWSLIPNGSVSNSSVKIKVRDNNILGFGHELKTGYNWYHTTGDDSYNLQYFVPNIKNTYINATVIHGTDEYGNYIQSAAVDRPFFSPFAKWAGGVNVTKNYRLDSIMRADSVSVAQDFEFIAQDYWGGHAVQIFKGNTENSRTTNFISSLRFLHINYLQKPIEELDTLHTYADENIYLASVGISTRKYVRDKYIFTFGVTEDVPIGQVFGITGGYRERRNSGHVYLGGRMATGNYYPWGYLGTNLEFGTYLVSGKTQQGVATASIDYFTGLIKFGQWRFRQFIKPEIVLGINRLVNDSLTLNDGFGLGGFNSKGLTGTDRMLITFQTQSYAPWDILGFRFGPYVNFSMGMLSNEDSGFRNSRLYSQIGFGLLIKNENLVIRTFEFSISFYPIIPGVGNNVVKVNSFKATDFGFRDFVIGKPGIKSFE